MSNKKPSKKPSKKPEIKKQKKQKKVVAKIVTKDDDIKKEQQRTIEKKAAMIEALRKTLGVVTPACELVGISRNCHYEWLNSDPEYKDAVNSMDEIALDFVESKLFQSIRNGSDTTTIFYMKTKGKKRGYIERQETEHMGSLNVRIENKERELEERLSKMSDRDLELFKKNNLEAQKILKKYDN